MARRNQHRKGSWLFSDDYTGFTKYSSKAQVDYWGNIVASPLKRNLQEIASPLNDPEPVPFYRGPTYETIQPYQFDSLQLNIGSTGVRKPKSWIDDVMGWDTSIGTAQVGINFVVR